MPEARLFHVSGRVQGVGYRDFARRHAVRLGLSGHAKNLADGRVEVYAVGAAEAIGELRGFLHNGPPWSEVRHIDEAATPQTQVNRFKVL